MTTFYLDNKGFAASLITVFLAFLLLVWFSYQRAETSVYRDTAEHLVSIAELQADVVQGSVLDSERHVRFLHATPPVQGIVRATQHAGIDPREATPYPVWVSRLQTIFSAYARNNPNIAQIRYIGLADNGRELVRVNQDGQGVEVIPDAQLQVKGDRDYFQASLNLKPGEVYFSSINLNREWGVIEQPAWPTYRVVEAVYDTDGRQFGMIVVNFKLQAMFDALVKSVSRDLAVFLLNENGQFLLHPDPTRNFEFEYGLNESWESSYEESPQEIAYRQFFRVGSPQHPDERYFALKQDILLPEGAGVRHLTLVSAMRISALASLVWKRQVNLLLIDTVLLLVVLALLVLYWLFSKKSMAELGVRAQFEAIVRGSSDIILGLDCNGRVMSCNQAALTLLGWQPDAAAEHKLTDIVYTSGPLDTSIQPLQRAFEAVCQGRKGEPVTIRLNRSEARGDEPCYASVALSPIVISQQRINGVAAIIRDMTEARNLQLHLQQTNQTLVEKNDEMERFIYTVAHDLKSPLVTIGGFTQSVLRDMATQLDAKNTHRMQRVLANVNHMGDLLNDLLSLSRIAKAPVERQWCELTYCVDKVRDSLSTQLQESRCELVLEAAHGPVYANEQMLVQCLQNLIENAVHYRHPERPPRIEIECTPNQSGTQVAVRDNGLGIESRHHERIFRIFERLDASLGEGTGVGLAIVKAIMEKHQGTVVLQSTPGVGSTFFLRFPAPQANREEQNESD